MAQTTLTPEQAAEYKEAFNLFDEDGDGAISTEQIGTVMRSVGLYITEARLNEIVQTLNANGNGKTDLNEFLQQMEKELQLSKNQNIEKDLRDAFKVFDTDQDGIIPAAELRHYLIKLGECLNDNEVDQMLKEVDVNGTGQIKCEDFIKVMLQK